jgi:hypothetical protein
MKNLENSALSLLFFPKALIVFYYGRSSGSFYFLKPSHTFTCTVAKEFKKFVIELTAAGTAPDLHRIPF